MATRGDYYSWLFQAFYYTVYVVVCLGKIANFCSFHLKLGYMCTIFNMECMEWRPYSAYRKMNFTQNFDNGHKRDYHSWPFQALYYTVYVVVCLGKIANFCSFHL